MRLRLIVPQIVLCALGVTVMVGELSGSWATGALAGLVSAAMVALSAAVVLSPFVNRIRALARAVGEASDRERSFSSEERIRRGGALREQEALGLEPDALQRTEAGARGRELVEPFAAGPVIPAPGDDDDPLERADRIFADVSRRWEERGRVLAAEATTLTAVLDGMSEGIWVTDTDGTIIRHNVALAEILQPPGAIVGATPLALVRSTELNAAVLAACQQMITTRLEIALDAPRPRTLAIQVMPLRGGHKGSAAVFHDLTELRRLEKIRRDFVANVSHELRTPIAAIRGYSETLQAGALDDRAHAPKMVEIIHRQSERLSALVNDLLDLARLESGDQKLERVTVNVAEVAARAADAVQPRAHEKGLALSVEVDRGLWVTADARALEQVLLNLVENAVKYTPSNRSVQVGARRVDGRIAMSVRDTGLGIEEKHLGRIFERFYRADKGRSRETGGTGLGLSIVKHLVTTMGGEVRVQSEPGKGSEFTVLLPEARVDARAQPVQGVDSGPIGR